MNARYHQRYESKKNRLTRVYAYDETFSDFTCAHCRRYVSVNSAFSGVQNRNHCPYCLWSKHLDMYAAGDRMAACKSPMRPVGLTFKKGHNKYSPTGGELMLVHQCLECDKLSINRTAADDDSETVLALFGTSASLDAELRMQLERSEIQLLEAGDEQQLRTQVFGRSFLSTQ